MLRHLIPRLRDQLSQLDAEIVQAVDVLARMRIAHHSWLQAVDGLARLKDWQSFLVWAPSSYGRLPCLGIYSVWAGALCTAFSWEPSLFGLSVCAQLPYTGIFLTWVPSLYGQALCAQLPSAAASAGSSSATHSLRLALVQLVGTLGSQGYLEKEGAVPLSQFLTRKLFLRAVQFFSHPPERE